MRIAIYVALWTALVALTGCAGVQLQPPPLLTVPQIQAQQALTAGIPAAEIHDFYVNGLTLAQMQCGGFFDAAVMNALQNAQTAGQAQILSGLASGIMGLAGVGGPATAGVGMGAALVSNMISNQQSNSLAGTDPAGLYTLTGVAQQTLIASISEPVTGADAYAAVYAVERACTPAGIQALKEQAIAAAPNHLGVIGGSSAPGPLAAPAMRGMLPAPPMGRSPALPMVRVN